MAKFIVAFVCGAMIGFSAWAAGTGSPVDHVSPKVLKDFRPGENPLAPAYMIALCDEAVRQQASRADQLLIAHITPMSVDDVSIACLVDAERLPQQQREQYVVTFNVKTGKAVVAKNDLTQAAAIAEDVLSKMLITMKPVSAEANRVVFTADVAGTQTCRVTVTKGTKPQPETWLISALDCKKAKAERKAAAL